MVTKRGGDEYFQKLVQISNKMENDISGDLGWIDVGYGDLSEDCLESDISDKKNGASRGRLPSARLLERRLRRASARGDAAKVTELLRGGCGDCEEEFPNWPHKILRNALKCAADAATVAAFASEQPEFFHGKEGASIAVFLALKSGKEETVGLLLAAGISPEAESRIARYGARPLHWACAWGRPDATRLLLEAGADATARVEEGLTPLHIAANRGHTACVEALLSAGTEVDLKTEEGWTALHHASGSGHVPCVRALLEAGAAVDARGDDGRSSLHLVCRGFCALYLPYDLNGRCNDEEQDYAQCCELLLAHGLDVRSVDEDGMTPLYHAISNRNNAVLAVLGRAGADLAEKLDNGETALHAASSCNGFENVIEDLVALGLDINACTTDGWTPLHQATCNWNVEGLEVLLRLGADITIESESGDSPLFMAASNGFTDGLQAMLKAGADPKQRASDGRTLLHAAATSSREMMDILVVAGVDINARADDGSTPLHFAVRTWNPTDCLSYLLERGADLQARDNRGWTATHFCASGGFFESMRWLIEHAASDATMREVLGVSARAADGATPLHVAAASSESYVVKLLLDMGASVANADAQGRTALHTAARGTCEETLRTLLESGRGGDRMRRIRDANGETAAQVAHLAAIQRMLERWSVAG